MEVLANDVELNLDSDALPRFIAVEGPIGVGKTTLAKRLADTFNYDTLLEQPDDNPFLERFYNDRRSGALPAQLFFLFQRARQIQQLRQRDMFRPMRIADFLMDKDPLFAQVTLDDDELRIYQTVYEQLTIDAPAPDLVIYLQAPTDVLLERIQLRKVAMERHIDHAYLDALNDAYTRLFHVYDSAPLLIVNAAEIDLVNNADDYRQLVKYLLSIKSGRHYYNPHPNL